MPATLEQPRRRVAVADDNPTYREQRSHLVDLAGFEPVPLNDRYDQVQDLIDAIQKAGATGLVCDHKLTEGNYAGFEGVEAVAALYSLSIPGILVTDYGNTDLRQSIQRHRKLVPVLIRGTDLRPPKIAEGIAAWEQEVIGHDVPVSRRPRRAVVIVDDITPGASGRMLTVFVPRWREHEAVSLPEDMVPTDIRASLKKGSVLTASVNTEADRIEDLFFEDFELTPDEDLESEPA
jgi:hypothetical protein